MRKTTKTDILKKQLLKALELSLGVVSTACKKANIARSTFYQWYNEDSEFRDKVDELEDISLDFAESKLFEQMNNGNVTSIIFYLKTKGAKRGYVEVQQHQIQAKPFTHIEIEEKFDNYEEIKAKDNKNLPEESSS
tara:strand:- start:29 stop:436 length:408 start_codon:yes stop_codon:yes gene_type:complete